MNWYKLRTNKVHAQETQVCSVIIIMNLTLIFRLFGLTLQGEKK